MRQLDHLSASHPKGFRTGLSKYSILAFCGHSTVYDLLYSSIERRFLATTSKFKLLLFQKQEEFSKSLPFAKALLEAGYLRLRYAAWYVEQIASEFPAKSGNIHALLKDRPSERFPRTENVWPKLVTRTTCRRATMIVITSTSAGQRVPTCSVRLIIAN